MYHKHSSSDSHQDKENKRYVKNLLCKQVMKIRFQNNRKTQSASPYSASYRTNLTHDQRALISHRTYVNKLSRVELEDRYITLLDEHFCVKKDNLLNHDKIRKLVTKIMRLSGETNAAAAAGSSSVRALSASRANLTHDEDMQIRMIDLESHNVQLKERLNDALRARHGASRSRCASATTMRATSNTPSLMARNGRPKL